MTPPSPIPDACGTAELVVHDDSPQIPHVVDTQMGEPEHQPMPHSPPIFHIDVSDEESTLPWLKPPRLFSLRIPFR